MGEVHLPQALQDVADLRPPGHKNHDATLNTFTMDHFNHLKHQLEVDRISLAKTSGRYERGRFVAVLPAFGFFSTPLIHSRFIHNLRILHINSMTWSTNPPPSLDPTPSRCAPEPHPGHVPGSVVARLRPRSVGLRELPAAALGRRASCDPSRWNARR